VDENDDWDSYDKFTEAIDVLEECAGYFPCLFNADIFADFCSNRQKLSKMRCNVTLASKSIRASTDTLNPLKNGPTIERRYENLSCHFAPSQNLGWAHVL
jgi:hypothetical protein